MLRLLLLASCVLTVCRTASLNNDARKLVKELLDELSLTGASKHYEHTNQKSSSKPNILFFIADDMGYNDIGFHNAQVKTGNLSELATTGVILDNSYAQAVCTPSRHALMTGKYPYKSGMSHGVLGEDTPYCSPTNLKFLPQRLKEHGYDTYAIGKWHLGFCKEACLPTRRGFDHFYGCYSGAEGFYDHSTGGGYDWREDEVTDRSVAGKYHTHIVTDYVVNRLRNQNSDKPFFMYVSYTNVHTPLEVPSYYEETFYPDMEPSNRRKYLAMASAMDVSVGQIVQTLRDIQSYDNTIIIFTSDNGGEPGGFATNAPLRGGKGSVYEGGSKVISFVHSPLLKKTGYNHPGLFHITDWTKTLMRIISGEDVSDVDGYDQSSMILSGEDSKRNEVVYNLDLTPSPFFGQSAVRVNNYKLIWGFPGYADGRGFDILPFYKDPQYTSKALERGAVFSPQDYALMGQIMSANRWTDKSNGPVRLFDLSADPNEENDLSQSNSDKVEELKDYILGMKSDYVQTSTLMDEHRFNVSNPAKFGGEWTSGWCEEEDLTVNA